MIFSLPLWRSLKTRLTLFTLLIFLIGVWSLAFYASRLLRDDMQRLLGEQQFSTVSFIAADIEHELSDRLDALKMIAGSITPALMSNAADLQSLLEQRPVFLQLFNGGVFVTRIDGTAIADLPLAANRLGANFMERDHVAAALKEGKATIGQPVIGKKLLAPLFATTVPIRDARNKVIGALSGVINLNTPSFLDKVTESRYAKSGGYLLAAPQHRLFVTASDKSRVMQALPAPGINPMHDKYMQGYEGYGVAISSRGIEELSAAKGIPVAGWFIVAVLPSEEAFAPVRAMQQRMLLAAILLTLLAGALTWWITAWMLRRQLAPMLAATKTLTALSKADHAPQALPIDSQDEIGELIAGFNRLLETLAQREEALRDGHETLRTILKTTLDGYWRVDRQGHLLDVNPTYCLQSGYSRDELLAMHVTDLEAEENSAETAEHIQLLVERKRDLFRSTHRRKDGSTWHVEISVTYSSFSGGQFFVFLRDVSERKRAKQHLEALVERRTAELSGALDAAKLADQTKDAFLANMSHELRTPLNAVIGMAGLARKISSDPKLNNYLDKISVSGKHLNRIINDLLDLSKITAGYMEFERITFSLRALIQRCISTMSFRADEKGLQLTAAIDDAVPDALVGDPSRIEQILLNLLGNAIKFTASGRVEVRVGLLAREATRICLDIQIEDSGIGMSPADIKRLFKPFAQADATVSRRFGGTGLGLAISKRLTEMMDGEIGVSSHEGIGSTLQVKLWLEAGDVASLQTETLAANEALPARYENAHILVAEDQPINREIVEELLAAVGITPCMTEDGQQALDALNAAGAAAFDLVLMDIQMPVVDGLTATRSLRSQPAFEQLPIIAMSAHTMAHEREISFAAGMNDHIGKPFDNASFYRTLAKWIPASKQRAAAESNVAPAKPTAPNKAGNDLSTLRGIDVRNGLMRFNGKEDRYRHWLADFVENAGALPGQIGEQIAAGAADQAARTAHAFKGRVGMLGMTELHGVVSTLEHTVRAGAPAEELLTALAQSIAQLRDELIQFFEAETNVSANDPQVLEKAVWQEAFSVGVAELDEQHKKLIDMINRLADCQGSTTSAVFSETLSSMFDYTEIHFKTEEAHLQRIGYLQLAAHEKEHAAFVEKMVAFNLMAADGVLDVAGLHRYLKTWLLSHILKSDMQYRHFVEENNLQQH